MPFLNEFPLVRAHIQDLDNLYDTLDWQRTGSKIMLRHYFKHEDVLKALVAQARYFYAPVGNLPGDVIMFGADLFYARLLQKSNFVLWYSPTEKPDFGGSENDDSRYRDLLDFNDPRKRPECFVQICFPDFCTQAVDGFRRERRLREEQLRHVLQHLLRAGRH